MYVTFIFTDFIQSRVFGSGYVDLISADVIQSWPQLTYLDGFCDWMKSAEIDPTFVWGRNGGCG